MKTASTAPSDQPADATAQSLNEIAPYASESDKTDEEGSKAGNKEQELSKAPEAPQNFDARDDEATRIKQLAATARDQNDLEKDIGRQADQMLLEQADERDQRRKERTITHRDRLVGQVRKLRQRIEGSVSGRTVVRLHAEIEHLQPQIDNLNNDLAQIERRVAERQEDAGKAEQERDKSGNQRMHGESRRDFLIRTGKITPFSNFTEGPDPSADLADMMMYAEENEDPEYGHKDANDVAVSADARSHRNLLQPGFLPADDNDEESESSVAAIDPRPRKRVRLQTGQPPKVSHRTVTDSNSLDSGEDYRPEEDEAKSAGTSAEESDDYAVIAEGNDQDPRRRTKKKSSKASTEHSAVEDLADVDDGNEILFQARLRKWIKARRAARGRASAKLRSGEGYVADTTPKAEDAEDVDSPESEEWFEPHPTRPDHNFNPNFKIPGDIYPSLFDYQKTGVQWLSELFEQRIGGIIGDEMGLGKTVQVIAFLAGLHYSRRLTQPVIVVTPATVMKQWVNEFHRWWPALRVSILHSSGSGMMNMRREEELEDDLDERDYGSSSGKTRSKTSSKAAKKIVDRVLKDGHVLVTTYSGLQSYSDLLLPVRWGYAVLDEGHKIRNPNAAITIYCKELRTPNRIILSGTPMQNNLTELWSLFDFIFPMRLGTLVSFRQKFDIPIRQGGYANASNLEVETALQCAQTLKDAISPYLLQRFKVDVAADLPKKSEQVLFCRLTKPQREAYESFLNSRDMDAILRGRRQALFGIDILRKVCNHPDLQDHKNLSKLPGYPYGAGTKSGKMQVVKALLELWRDTGHKTLLFAQHRIMLDILESFIKKLGGFKYCRMDGTTNIKDRQDLVDEFNNSPELHVFLLTTKVGGLGVNLTGADRVIIYDPDWNPSTDMQARERAWRLGQKRDVMIYRLMTAGTIEEKIYHRQIFKQFLTNKILRDPKQRQTFQLKDLHDLFTLADSEDDRTETSGMFKGSEINLEDGQLKPREEAADDNADSGRIKDIFGVARWEAFKAMDEQQTAAANGADPSTRTTLATKAAAAVATAAEKAADAVEADDAGPESMSTAATGEAKKMINDTSRLMSTIFARSGVHSAHEHDAIVNGTSSIRGPRSIQADPQIIAAEAKRVAAIAARELQRAEEAARKVPEGTPTWTGTFGVAGRPGERSSPAGTGYGSNRGGLGGRRGGRGGGGSLGSASIMSSLQAQQRQHAPGAAPGPRVRTSPAASADEGQTQQPRGKDFIKLIRDYILAQGGTVYTQMLIDHFNRYCRTPARTAEFTEMLRTIAVLEKRPAADDTGADRGGDRGAGGVRLGRFQVDERGIGGRQVHRGPGVGGRGRWTLKRAYGGTA